jgi:3-hydroxyacyl-CoA dehydrogenase
MGIVSIAQDGGIAVVTVDNPPVNALSQPLRQGLWDAVEALDADASVRAVVLLCAGRTFIAGADVTEFGKPPVPPHLPDLVDRIEGAAKPWVAAIHGSALGGGFEVAMGCRFRVAVETASVGLPEVGLGIVPGASGTVRTPRLAGVEAAVDLITSGRPVKAGKARAMGLLDAVVTGDLQAGAVAFARAALDAPLPPPVSARAVTAPDPSWWEAKRAEIAARARGEMAPLRALDCLRAAAEKPFREALAQERATFLDLRGSDQAAALRHIFFAERAAPRPAHLAGITPLPLRRIGVVGGGQMGAGIAAALREAGLPVVLVDRDAESVAQGLARLSALLDAAVARGRITAAEATERLAGVTAGSDMALMSDADLVIEAVFEDLPTKRAVFARLAQVCRPETVLATNTSYLAPQAIAQGLPRPDRFLGLHFFSPAHVMKLVEVVALPDTASETLATGFALARSLGKIPVQAGPVEGFIGNRILRRTRAEALALLREGLSPAAVDAAMRAYGLAMGPFETQDLSGLDIAFRHREAARAAGQEVAETFDDLLVRAGRLGQKSGGGWYDYAPGERRPIPSAKVTALLAPHCAPAAVVPPEEIADRLVGVMAAEGQAILSEGVARQAADIDLVMVHGYGFPRWRGGPMFAKGLR